MTGLVLDASTFIALERRDETMTELTRLFAAKETPLVTSAGVVAQVWRGGTGRQAPLAFLLRRVRVVELSFAIAKRLGLILGATGTRDPIDAHVVFLARERGWPVLTADADDLLAIDPSLDIERV